MIKNQVYRLGSVVASIRRDKGVQQVALAQALEMSGTRLSAIERSRVVGVSDDAVRRIARALKCDQRERDQMLKAAVYDRQLREAKRNFKQDYQVEVISIAVDVALELVEEQARGVVSRLRRFVYPTADWNKLPVEGASTTNMGRRLLAGLAASAFAGSALAVSALRKRSVNPVLARAARA